MIESIDFTENQTPQPETQPRLIYVLKVGEAAGQNIYHFMFSEDIDSVWMPQWNEKPACNCRFLEPEESMYSYVKEIRTDIDLITCVSACCNSYGDITDGVLSIAYENIDYYETYPEPFRLVFHFGDTMQTVDDALSQRGISSTFVR